MTEQFQQLMEKKLILKRLVVFAGLTSAVGLSSFFFPYVYSIVPVYETQMCFTYFESSHYVIPQMTASSEDSIVQANILSFITFNWLELLAMVLIIFKIRNAKDELNIQKELVLIMILWILFSLGYFATLFYEIDKFMDPD